MIPEPFRNCSILIVDDEEANLDLLEGLLSGEGYRRLTRADGRTVMDALADCAPDLVLLDLHMPHRSGFDVLAELRRLLRASDYLPVLVLTADATPLARDRALSEGARDFLTKPFDAVEVLLRVRNLLDTKLLQDLQREAREAAEAAAARARLLAEASRLLAGSLDSETAVTQVAALLVRELADGCVFYLVDDDGARLRTVSQRGAWFSELPDAARRKIESELTQAIRAAAVRTTVVHGRAIMLVPIATRSSSLGGFVAVTRPGEPVDAAATGMLEDLAARIALAIENAQLFAAAQLASRARERMLSVVAHDLRNPLAVVAMYSEMLLGLHPPDGDRYVADALSSIHRSTHRMQQQVEDLLDVGRLQQGTFSLNPAACGARDLFREVDLLLRPLAVSADIELVVEPLPGCSTSTQVRLDAARLQQVIANLVGNALKFTPPGGRVAVDWWVGEGGLRVGVSDTGPGIPNEQIPHIFGAFWQARDGDRRGVGLGLWIARSIVEAHGGRIWVDSVPGQGATFHFAIPPDIPGQASDPEPASMGRLTHARKLQLSSFLSRPR